MNFLSKEIIVIVGYGWVGQANALALLSMGYDVFYFDIQEPKLHYEKEHKKMYFKIKKLKSILEKDSLNTWYLVCVGDQIGDDGEQNISAIKNALDSLESAKGGIILRSTVLPEKLNALNFHYYLPEFLHEKKAVEECLTPQYYIIGSNNKTDRQPSFLDLWERSATKSFHGTPEEASYLKYLSNIWNALRITFVNEFGNMISIPTDKEKLANIEKIIDFFFERKSYLRYGRSYGGHCLPKDVHAFHAWYKKNNKEIPLIESIHKSNLIHKVIEAENTHLPEWFSEWVRPQVSGRAALRALKASIVRNLKKPFQKF